MRSSALSGVILSQLLLGAVVHGQSLGDVARKEEVRRKTVTAPGKVYTNDNLRPSDMPAPPPATAPAAGSSATPPAADAAPQAPAGAGAEVRDEKYWRGRIDAARTALQRAQTFQDALQSRINALSADFVNRDDPAQRNTIAADRQKALAELDRVKQEIATAQKSISDTQEEARRANVPPGWVR